MSNRTRRSLTAGLFDIRMVIGALLGLYGLVLLLEGIFGTSSADVDRSAGVNANLWAGIALLLVAAFFAVWARLRPIVVPDPEEDREER